MSISRSASAGLGVASGVWIFLAWLLLASPAAAGENLEGQVRKIASGLRCPVCQNLSVADSSSEMAGEMRGLILDQLKAGRSLEEIRAYFVSKYGEWILLSPTPRGFGLLVWIAPFLALGGGLAGGFLVLLRWARRVPSASQEVDPSYLLRVRREVEQRRGG